MCAWCAGKGTRMCFGVCVYGCMCLCVCLVVYMCMLMCVSPSCRWDSRFSRPIDRVKKICGIANKGGVPIRSFPFSSSMLVDSNVGIGRMVLS